MIVQQWVTINGEHAENALRVSMWKAPKKKKPAAIARYTCVNRKSSDGKRFDSYGKKYREYQNALRKIGRIKAMISAGTLSEILDISKEEMDTKAKKVREKLLRSKSVRSSAHGRHMKNPDHEMEEKL